MGEQLKALIEKASKRLDLVTTGALVLLLVIAGYLYWKEKSYVLPEPPAPSPKKFSLKLPFEEGNAKPDETYVAAVERIETKFVDTSQDIDQDPSASRLVRVNMFDRKSAESEREIEAQINRDYNRAEALVGEENYEEALQVIDSILEKSPNHRLSLDLKDRIETLMNPETPSEGGT